MDQIPRLANEFGLSVTAGAWLDGDKKKNEREIKQACSRAPAPTRTSRA